MKPNFALNLTHEGISLLHRAKTGWTLLGDVRLDDPDLNARLKVLRETAVDLEQGGIACKLVIPDSQILYTEIPAPGPDEAARLRQIREGLAGLTPYAVEDLVFDWKGMGTKAQVAVVAQETLREAESFANDFRFNPVSFVGMPHSDGFEGEPFFGVTEAASAILEGGDTLEPDLVAIEVIGESASAPQKAKPPPAEDTAAPDPEPAEKPKPKKSKKKKKAATPAAPAAKVPSDGDAPASATKETEETDEPAAEAPASTEEETAAVTFASRRGHASATAEPASSYLARPHPPVAPLEPLPPEPAEPRDQVDRYSALDIDDVPDLPHWNTEDAAKATPPPVAPEPIPAAALSAPVIAPKPNGAGGAAMPAESRFALGGLPGTSPNRLRDRKAAIAAAGQEASSMTVFGERGTAGTRGKPKYLGLTLTFLLLLALGVAALWSMLFAPDGAPETPPQIAAIQPTGPIEGGAEAGVGPATSLVPSARPAAAEAPPAPEVTAPEVASPEPGDSGADVVASTQEPAPLQNAIDSAVNAALGPAPAAEADLPDTTPAAPLGETTTALETDPAAANDSATAPAPDAASGTPPETDTAEPVIEVARLDPPAAIDLSQSAPPDRVTEAPPSRAEAERRYATSGVWQLDPDAPADPQDGDRLEGLQLASLDPSLQAATPQGLPSAGPDARPVTLAPPAPLGVSFDLDERGLVRASPGGTLAPSGTVVYLGLPPVTPQLRPGTPEPSSTPEPTVITPEQPEAPAQTSITPQEPVLTPEQERLREFRPQARPANFEETFNQAPNGENFTETELAAIRPVIRPPSIQEEVAADEAPVAGEDATELAVAASRLPKGRPASVATSARRALASARVTASREVVEPPTQGSRTSPTRDVAAAVVPRIPSRASVAKAATEKNAINLSKVNLIGVYGSPSDRRALVRLKSGRYVKVVVGDRVDGGRVAAIGQAELRYVKGGRNITLKLPRG
ncbi:Translation initiation factor 2 (IF-2 GTPase) [Candidatus Rhodobacter oscarellae]|uniref:Translation initiation factor 2 (IF-2 GTPase) n=1 Tax=Candidatus Rhodobacter oscarellae TaxID=1675527 RepID=A0A0J9E4U2_9RHOB|nr:hypothetical protein [Candidatus Rhodobacter lobularis]KMW57766.1 Translation initiation factor 2 (IF-2 GTPase) [Candidatus Rhodobacter lobularis]